MLLILLFALMLIIMLMRITLPIGARVEGKAIREVSLSFQERILLQRTNIYAIGAVLLLAAFTGVLPRLWELLVLVAVIVLLLMRVQYIITNKGVAMNNVVYRPWSDFTAFEVRRCCVRLVPRDGLRPLDLRVLGKHMDQVLVPVRSHLPEFSRRADPAE